MGKYFTFFSIALFLIAQSAFGQISLTASDFANFYSPGNNYTDYYDFGVTSIDIGSPGGGNTWDFSNLQKSVTFNSETVAPSSSPMNGEFPEANYTVLLKSVNGEGYGAYTYFHLGEKFETCGMYSIDPGVETISHNDPFGILAELPLTAGASWTQNFEVVTTTNIPPIVMTTTSNITVTIVVDAWGTLLVPDNSTPVEALRIREDRRMTTHSDNGGEDSYSRIIRYFFATKSSLLYAAGIGAADTNAADNGVIEVAAGAMWRDPNLTSANDENSIVDNYKLEQNYPNPFTKGAGGGSSTTINFALPQSGFVTLTVFNSLGQQVARLADSELQAGNHQVRFNGTNLPSGTYFYQLRAGNFVQTKKCILIK